MLKQTIAEKENSLTPLLFKGNLVDLGSYREFIHRHEVARSFYFKVTLPMPKSLTAPFQFPDYIFDVALPQAEFGDLEESLKNFPTVGIGIAFSHSQDQYATHVSQIDLFIGKNPIPAITYGSDFILPHAEGKLRIVAFCNLNEKHEYWASHWKTFDKEDDTHVRAVLEKASEAAWLDEKQEAFEKLSPEDQEAFTRELQSVASTPEAEEEELATGTFPHYSAKFPQEVMDKLLKLTGFELAIETYKILRENDMLGLRGFLPDTLDFGDMSDIISYFPEEYSRNLSVLALTVAPMVRRVLDETLYIGPLRNFPERYFMYSGISSDYVGKSGNFVPDILVSDTELLAKVNEQFERFDLGYELKLSSLSDETTAVHDLFALRLYDKSTGIHVGTTDVGFGFSQVLPVIAQCLISKKNMILIEQPELHLHPRLQAELGDLFIDSALGDPKNTLIIETHSEHLILRLLRRIRESAEGKLSQGQIPITPDDLAVVYAKPTKVGTKLVHLRVTEDGDFADPWPDGFFAERAKELL
jgi:hypothetical protein